MKNRYDGSIREADDLILSLTPGNSLKSVLALDLTDRLRIVPNPRIIEIGCGQGELALRICKLIPHADLTLVDVSPEMITHARRTLRNYRQAVFIEDDAEAFLEKSEHGAYDCAVSTWVVHNIPWEDKKKLFKGIFSILKEGGELVLMDKIYPDDSLVAERLHNAQIKRYQKIPGQAGNDLLMHETVDFSDAYRMSETQTEHELRSAGFSAVITIDRIGRDLLIRAVK